MNPESGLLFPADVLTGSQTITVEPVLLNVTASTPEFTTGDTVHFALQSELTATSISWTFSYTAGGSLSLSVCNNQPTCDATPTGSGRIYVNLTESVTHESLSTRSAEVVQKPACDTTKNPILADSGVRRVMANALAAGMTDTTYGKRREHGGAIFKYPDGHYEAQEFPAPDATDCALGDMAVQERTDGSTMVALFHTHPYKVKEMVPQCGTLKFSKKKEVGGVAPEDYASLDALNQLRASMNLPPLIEFVWDRTHVYRYSSDMPKDKRGFRPNAVDHTRTDCAWTK